MNDCMASLLSLDVFFFGSHVFKFLHLHAFGYSCIVMATMVRFMTDMIGRGDRGWR
jgi:hypothetical protein